MHEKYSNLQGNNYNVPPIVLKEQHQALLYQLVQQHQPEVQQLQLSGATQIPINNLLAVSQASPLHTTATNPFLAVPGDIAAPKVSVSI